MGGRGSRSGMGGGGGGGGSTIQAEKLQGNYQISKDGLVSLQGTDKQIAWANDIRNAWIDQQNQNINEWSEVMPSLAASRAKAEAVAKQQGVSQNMLEHSAVYNDTIVAEMKARGFEGTANQFKDAWDSYASGSAISDLISNSKQQKVLKKLGMESKPKTKDVENRVKVYSESVNTYLATEKRSSVWINLRSETSRRVDYDRGIFRTGSGKIYGG